MTVSSKAYTDLLAEAGRFLQEHDEFLVVSHVNPDGDAASSTYAMGLLLQQLGKTYTLVNEGPIPHKFSTLSAGQTVYTPGDLQASLSFTYVICVDCADYARVGEVAGRIAEGARILNIDHHATNEGFGEANLIRVNAASTTEVLFDLVQAMGARLDLPLANCLYTGLLTDTGGFRYANTSPYVLEIASKLIGVGVTGAELAEAFLESITRAHIELLKRSLHSLSFSACGRIAWVSVTLDDIQQSGASDEDLEGLVNYPRNIEGVQLGLLFKQRAAETVKVSLRSGGTVDVSQVAKAFGGGGHVRASGCTINRPLEEAIRSVVDEVERALT